MSHPQSNTVVSDDQPDENVSMTEAFRRFHAKNPHVYDVLVQLAREWKARGKGPTGIALFYERARWELSLALDSDGMFGLSQNHRAFYARAIMLKERDLAGVFTLKAAPEADAWAADYAARLAGVRRSAA